MVRLARGVLYVDTSIEPWPGVFDNPMLDHARAHATSRTREDALQLAAELKPDSPTAVVDHGANPGLVSHFVKRRCSTCDRTLRKGRTPADQPRAGRRSRAISASRLIQISERDTQATDRPKRPGEFVNTWSIDGFVDELMQPSELSIGTAEQQPPGGHADPPAATRGTLSTCTGPAARRSRAAGRRRAAGSRAC